MKRIIIKPEEQCDTINLDEVRSNTLIFAKENGKLAGVVVREEKGWILRIGGPYSTNGYKESRQECLCVGRKSGYEFYVV